MKVLIIDDSPDALAIARTRLLKENLDILCAANGQDGLEMAKREKPDLVLLDVDMPGLSGIDVCRRMKAEDDLCMIPIIFLSGAGGAEEKARGLDIGAVDYISKPFDAFELRARVRAALRTKHLQDLLIEYAHIDPLTGLPNRRALMEYLGREWARLQRHGGKLSLIMADIDHFKGVNDTFGHDAGDRVLQEVGRILRGECRHEDLPARYGGEEFAIIVPDVPATEAAGLAERCRQRIEEARVCVGANVLQTTISLGVADARDLPSAEILIRHADDMLYKAKSAGRNTVWVEQRLCQLSAGPSPAAPDRPAAPAP